MTTKLFLQLTETFPFSIFPCHFFIKVSWIRSRDLHIMTIGILTYTQDQRFQAIHTEGSDEWSLRVMSPQPRDSGVYEVINPNLLFCNSCSLPGTKHIFRFKLNCEANYCNVWLLPIN